MRESKYHHGDIPCGSGPISQVSIIIQSDTGKSTYVINNLVRNTPIVLQNIEVLGSARRGNLLGHGLCDANQVSL